MKEESLKALKCNFKDIKLKNIDYSKLFKCIKNANEFTFMGYNLLRYHLLSLFEKNEEIPVINNEYIRRIFKSITDTSCGPKNKKSLDEFNVSCNEFLRITKETKKKATNLSYILNEEETKIVTAYSNNIKMNFQKYLFQSVNETYGDGVPRVIKISRDEMNKMTKQELEEFKMKNNEISKERKKQLRELSPVKKDLLMNSLNSDTKFHKFIEQYRKEILLMNENNEKPSKKLMDCVNEKPFKYLNVMLKMSKTLEDTKRKLFQALPLRTKMGLNNISLNSRAIRDIFGEIKNDRTQELSNKNLWYKYFNINPKKFKIKGYTFDDLIVTDGTSVSIIFMKNEAYKKKQIIHSKMSKASMEGKKREKIMTPNELLLFNTERDNVKNRKTEEYKNHQKEIKKEFANKTKKEKEKIISQMKLERDEFHYIDEVIKDEKIRKHLVNQLNKKKIVVGDPGCRSPITLNGNSGMFNYRKRRRIKETKRIEYTRLRQNQYKKLMSKTKANKINDELNKTCTKTTSLEKFKKYLKIKFELIKKIGNEQMDIFSKYINKLKWYAYINKRRHEDNLLNDIERKYGKDATIVIGDWSAKDHIKGMSSPNMGIKRLLSKRFEVYLVDEYNTSKINHLSKEEMKHLELKIKYKDNMNKIKEYSKEIYSVFTYKMSNEHIGCINRDNNATKNMAKIVESIIEGKGRPKEFQRELKKPIKKSRNPIKGVKYANA